jgi:hypothetical protein
MSFLFFLLTFYWKFVVWLIQSLQYNMGRIIFKLMEWCYW